VGAGALRPDALDRFGAFCDALRWSSIARLPGLTSDDAALISPWESAVHPEPYQLVPVLKAGDCADSGLRRHHARRAARRARGGGRSRASVCRSSRRPASAARDTSARRRDTWRSWREASGTRSASLLACSTFSQEPWASPARSSARRQARGAALYRSGEGVPEGTGARLEALADALVTPPADGPEARRDPVDELFFG